MKIKEYLDNIDYERICDKSEESDYWVSVKKFIDDIYDKDIEDLTEKQKNWFNKIIEDL